VILPEEGVHRPAVHDPVQFNDELVMSAVSVGSGLGAHPNANAERRRIRNRERHDRDYDLNETIVASREDGAHDVVVDERPLIEVVAGESS
jgi:hypothetical protein